MGWLTGLLTGQPNFAAAVDAFDKLMMMKRNLHSVIHGDDRRYTGQLFQKWAAAISSKTGDVPWYDAYRLCGAGQSVMGPFYCPADGANLYRLILR